MIWLGTVPGPGYLEPTDDNDSWLLTDSGTLVPIVACGGLIEDERRWFFVETLLCCSLTSEAWLLVVNWFKGAIDVLSEDGCGGIVSLPGDDDWTIVSEDLLEMLVIADVRLETKIEATASIESDEECC